MIPNHDCRLKCLIYTPWIPLCCWKPRSFWDLKVLDIIWTIQWTTEKAACLVKHCEEMKKNAYRCVYKKPKHPKLKTPQGLGFHNIRPQKTPGMEREQLSTHHWAGRMSTSCWSSVPLEGLAHGRTGSCQTTTTSAHPRVLITAIYHQCQQVKKASGSTTQNSDIRMEKPNFNSKQD